MTVLITPQTGAANSEAIDINLQKPVTQTGFDNGNYTTGCTFRVTGGALGSEEYVKLQYNDGTNWIDAEVDGDDAKILDEDNAVKTVYGRMTSVRVSKSVTSAARGVEVV